MRSNRERLSVVLFFAGIIALVIIMGGLLIWPLINVPAQPAASAPVDQATIPPATTGESAPQSQTPTESQSQTPPSAETQPPTIAPGVTAEPSGSPDSLLTAVAIGQPTQPTLTIPTEAGFNLSTSSAPTSTQPVVPNATPTFDDNPNLILTPFVLPADTPTPLPLTDLGSSVELAVAQVQRIAVSGGYVLVADVSNTTDSAVKNVSLVFTNASGARVGEAKPLNLSLPPNDARPGATAQLSLDDPIIANWSTLQVRAIGAPATAQPGQAGYIVGLEVSYPQVSLGTSGYNYEVTVTNSTGWRVSIPYQNIAFFANDGTLLLVVNLGTQAPLNAGESYQLTGTIPINQPVTEGRTLAEYTDPLANVVAEVGP